MSVIKAKRTKSRLEVIDHMNNLRSTLEKYIFHDFAIEGPLSYEEKDFLDTERYIIYKYLIDITNLLKEANLIRFKESTDEYMRRRTKQNQAIALCYDLHKELLHIVDTFRGKINVNKYMYVVDDLDTEIKLIKAWRRSDLRFRPGIIF